MLLPADKGQTQMLIHNSLGILALLLQLQLAKVVNWDWSGPGPSVLQAACCSCSRCSHPCQAPGWTTSCAAAMWPRVGGAGWQLRHGWWQWWGCEEGALPCCQGSHSSRSYVSGCCMTIW